MKKMKITLLNFWRILTIWHCMWVFRALNPFKSWLLFYRECPWWVRTVGSRPTAASWSLLYSWPSLGLSLPSCTPKAGTTLQSSSGSIFITLSSLWLSFWSSLELSLPSTQNKTMDDLNLWKTRTVGNVIPGVGLFFPTRYFGDLILFPSFYFSFFSFSPSFLFFIP